MKNNYILGMVLFFSIQLSFAQFVDDIEWENGDCPSHWPGELPFYNCPFQSQAQALSPTHSIIIPDDGTTDVILDLGNQIIGEWGLEFWMYIPTNKEAYWNLQGQVPVGSGEWIVGNIFFNQDTANPGMGLIDDCVGAPVTFNFPHDQWFKIVMNFDISNGIGAATWQFNVDGEDVLPFGTPFTNQAGTYPTSLGGIDFFSISYNNMYFLDDFLFTEGFINTGPNPIPFTDDMEWSTGNCPEHWYETCPPISTDYVYNGLQSGLIPGDENTDVVLNLGNRFFGEWGLEFRMYVPSGKEAYFTIEGEVPIGDGQSVVGNIYFDQDGINPGVGVIDDAVGAPVSFTFPHDEWFRIAMVVDISGGIGLSTWGMSVANQLVIPEGTPFTNASGTYPTSLGGINFRSVSSSTEFYLDDFEYTDSFSEFLILGNGSFNENAFKLFPNPAQILITIESEEVVSKISIYSQLGEKIMSKEFTNEIEVSHLATGLYFIEVETNSGKGIQKFIKN